ncbi:MAG: DUF4393 domain-containing protein [Arachnia sp.]
MVEVDPFKLGDTAGKLVVGAQDERRAEKSVLRDAAAGSTDLQLAARAHARRLAVREQFLLNLWRPLAKWAGVSKDYFQNEFPKELAAKLDDVPEDELQTPKPVIVAPAMEALGFSLGEPALKEMYLNLLAGASTKTKAHQVHPSFVDVIKQLSSEEAVLLDPVLRTGIWSLAQVRRIFTNDDSYEALLPYLLPLVHVATELPLQFTDLSGWIENWERLGLVKPTFAEHRVSRTAGMDPYDWVETRPEYLALKATEPIATDPDPAEWRVGFEKGILRATDRGNAFLSIVGSAPAQ